MSAEQYERLTIPDGTATRFGRIVLAGVVHDAEPIMPRRVRILDGLVISVVTRGSGLYWHESTGMVPIGAPVLTVALPRDPHWYGTRPGARWTEWFAVAEGPMFDMIVAAHQLRTGPRALSAALRSADLAQIIERPPPPAGAVDQVWALARWLDEALQPPAGDEAGRWEQARALLVADLSSPVDLAVIAERVGLSYEAFRRQFRARFGEPPLAYRNGRRLEAAANFLRLTALTCHDIAERLGYTDEFHLSRRFTARFGQPPSSYRKAARSP